MPLEAATSLEQLQDTWPLGGDSLNKGDDHVRLIKQVLKTQFPGVDLNGFKIPIIATEDEINFLSGVTTPIQTQFDDLGVRVSANEDAIANLIETGTKMMFYQAAAPTGWTIDTTVTDNMLRIVDGTILVGGAAGGTGDPVTHSHTTGSHALTEAEMPSHTHGIANGVTGSSAGGGFGNLASSNGGIQSTAAGGNGAHNHGATGDFVSRFANVILCTKD